MLEWGAKQSPEKIEAAYQLIAAQEARATQIFERCDVLIAPTAPQLPFKFGEEIPANQADFTAFANFADLPSTAIPLVSADNVLPSSVQIIGRFNEDGFTLAVAEILQTLI